MTLAMRGADLCRAALRSCSFLAGTASWFLLAFVCFGGVLLLFILLICRDSRQGAAGTSEQGQPTRWMGSFVWDISAMRNPSPSEMSVLCYPFGSVNHPRSAWECRYTGTCLYN